MNPQRKTLQRTWLAFRCWLGMKVWNLGESIYAYREPTPRDDTDRERQHEVSMTLWGCSDAEAEDVMLRVSDAVCGVEHHALECPGPSHVMSMHSGPLDDEDEKPPIWPSEPPITTSNGGAEVKVTYRRSA